MIVIHSSVEQVVSVSGEDETSNEKLKPPEDVEMTEIYDIHCKDSSAVERPNVEEVVVDSSVEVETPGKENIRGCDDDDSVRVIDSCSTEMMRNAVESGDLSDVRSCSRVERDSGDVHDRDVMVERSSPLSDSEAGNSPLADLLEVRVTVCPPVEQPCAAETLDSLTELKDKNDEAVDDGEDDEKCQVADDASRREEEAVERKSQMVDDAQDVTSVDVDDTSQKDVAPIDVDDTSLKDVAPVDVNDTSQKDVAPVDVDDASRRDDTSQNDMTPVDVDDTSQNDMTQVDVDVTSQQHISPADAKCQAVTDFSHNEVKPSLLVNISQQEVPTNDKSCSFVVNPTDVGVVDNQVSSDPLPDDTKDSDSKERQLLEIASASSELRSSANKCDFSSFDSDGFGGNADDGNTDSDDITADDVITRTERLSEESNERRPLPKTSKSSFLHTNEYRSAVKRDSIKRENGKYYQASFFQGCRNRELYAADIGLNGCSPDCGSTNNANSQVEIDGNEEVGRGDESARKSEVERDSILNGKEGVDEKSGNLMVEADCIFNSRQLKERAGDARKSLVEIDCIINSMDLKEPAENTKESMIETDCIVNGNTEIKELAVNCPRNSTVELDCIVNGNIGPREDFECRRESAASPPSECLETVAVDSLTYDKNCDAAKTELAASIRPAINAEMNGIEKNLVNSELPDAVIAKNIKTIELSNCCIESVDDR